MLRHLKDFLVKKIPRYAVGIIFLLIVNLLQLIVPQILKFVTDSILAETITDLDLMQFAILILITGVGLALLRYGWRVMISYTAADIETWVRDKLFRHLVNMPQNFYHQNKTGDLMAHATNDINTIKRTFSMGIVMSFDAIFVTVSTVIVMFGTTNVTMTLIALLPLPFIALVVVLMGKQIHRKFRSVQEGFSILSDKVQESFAGIEVIKSFAQEEENLADFNQKNHENLRRHLDLVRTHTLQNTLINFIGSLSMILGILIGGYANIKGVITLGDLVAFLQYLEMLFWPMRAFGMFANMIQRGSASIGRINRILDTPNELRDNQTIMQPKDCSIRVEDLSFTYKGEKEATLKNISVDIPAGSSLGIIGHTGSGKTSFIDLLTRLYNIPRGKIYIGEVDINDISIKDTREIIGSVPQDVFLFSREIKDNIGFTDREIDMDKVVASAQTARVHDEIMGFPQGYETLLGERGVNLSGGQRQRTAIARLLYKDSPVMIFDDSLSAVDTKTESQILQALQAESGKYSRIVISHRVSSLIHLDHIIVLEEGSIIEEGTHQELLEQEGTYARLYRKQQLEEQILQHTVTTEGGTYE